MPTKSDMIQMVAHQMMKGVHPGKTPGDNQQREDFRKRHEEQIEFVLSELPRCSAAVGAVLVKCLIKYKDKERVAEFCRSLKNCKFTGPNDPVHLLWKFLQKHKGKNTTEAYRRTVCAAKAFMERRPTLGSLRANHMDIFEWDQDWLVPEKLLLKCGSGDISSLDSEETTGVEVTEDGIVALATLT